MIRKHSLHTSKVIADLFGKVSVQCWGMEGYLPDQHGHDLDVTSRLCRYRGAVNALIYMPAGQFLCNKQNVIALCATHDKSITLFHD